MSSTLTATLRRRLLAIGLLLVAAAVAAPPAGAQGLLEAWRARRAQGAASAPASQEEQGLEGVDSGSGRVALPPGTRAELDLAYGSDPAQRLDAYMPREGKGAPIVVMVHGGAWMIGDKANAGVVIAKVAHWLPKGYIVVSTNYRMSRPPSPYQQAEDVGRALAFVQSKASSWGGDPSRVVLIGHSSGAHLVALLTAAPEIAARLGAKPWQGTVSLDSAALDVVQLMNARHPRFYDRVFGSDPSRWAEASPQQRLAGRVFPMLLVCSSRRSDSCPAARAFAARASSLGGRASVLVQDLNHGEINSQLGGSSAYTAAVDDFIRSLGLP